MPNEVDLNICSEDIFQSYSESSESKLRRSQRILERSEKTPAVDVCSGYILEHHSTQASNGSPSPNQMRNQTQLKASTDAENENDGDTTPDFTYMLNTQSVTLQRETSSTVVTNHTDDFGKDCPIDLRTTPKKNSDVACVSTERHSTQTIVKNSRKRTASDKRSQRVSVEMDVKNVTLAVKTSSLKLQNIPTRFENAKNATNKKFSGSKSVKPTPMDCETFDLQRRETMDNVLSTVTQDNMNVKTEEQLRHNIVIQSLGDINAPLNEKDCRKMSEKCTSTKRQLKRPSKTSTVNRKRRSRPSVLKANPKKQENKDFKTSSLDSRIVKDYIPPTVKRYYNSCPVTKNPCNPISSSSNNTLLPAVYPPHFTRQIMLAPNGVQVLSASIPITSLTPDNSQVASQPTAEAKRSSSSSSIAGSLQDFFELDELYEILDSKKIIYHLTEPHVRALALSLNVKMEDLIMVMDKIVELEPNALREECEKYISTTTKSTHPNSS